MVWQPLRTRPRYRDMKNAINNRLDEYWVAVSDPETSCVQLVEACEQIVLSAFRLLKYVRTNIGGLNYDIEDGKISSDINYAVIDWYCLGEGDSTSFQEESDVLEILSRTAYREMKEVKKKKIMQGLEEV